jgi:hypothetical protein
MGEYMNGKSFVLARDKFFSPDYAQNNACRYRTFLCNPLGVGAYDSTQIIFEYRDGSYAESPESVLVAPEVSMTTNDAIADCSDFTLEFPANSPFFSGESPAYANVTATVVSGGGSVEDARTLIDAGHVLPNNAPAFSEGTGVCGSCCFNEAATPAEITISITNLVEDPATGDLPDGDYVLPRAGVFFESLFPNQYNNNATIWGGFDIMAAIEPCAGVGYTGVNQNRAYFPADCGDTCYKKCRLKIEVSAFGFAGGQYDPGCNCLDFPVCSPPAGAYTLLSGFAATPYYTATIS